MLETLRSAWKIEDLRKKMIFTLTILVIFRIGSVIPVPFLDPTALKAMISSSGNLLGYIDILSGGAFAQSTIFALSISPYITASIVIQLLTIAIPYLENLAKEGEEVRKSSTKLPATPLWLWHCFRLLPTPLWYTEWEQSLSLRAGRVFL